MASEKLPLVERGTTFMVDFNPTVGHEQSGLRPAVAISVPELAAGGLLIVVPTTTKRLDKVRIYEVPIAAGDGVPEDSKALAQHIRVVDIEERVVREIGRVSPDTLTEIDEAILIVLGIV